jgi:hypothetical protein
MIWHKMSTPVQWAKFDILVLTACLGFEARTTTLG